MPKVPGTIRNGVNAESDSCSRQWSRTTPFRTHRSSIGIRLSPMCPYRGAGYIGCWRNSKTAMQTTEILVIGAGVIGNSIAYHLAQQGRQVLVVDQADIAATPSASWASAGGIRRQGRHAAEVSLVNESIVRWPKLGEELGADLHYRN